MIKYLLIAVLSIIAIDTNAQAYSYQVTKIQRSASDSLKRETLMNDLQKIADKTETENPWVSVVLRSLVIAMVMDKENELSPQCESISRKLFDDYVKELEQLEQILEFARKSKEILKKNK